MVDRKYYTSTEAGNFVPSVYVRLGVLVDRAGCGRTETDAIAIRGRAPQLCNWDGRRTV